MLKYNKNMKDILIQARIKFNLLYPSVKPKKATATKKVGFKMVASKKRSRIVTTNPTKTRNCFSIDPITSPHCAERAAFQLTI